MNTDDVLGVLDRLDAGAVEWWIDGGWGVDALLGEETRPHDDLDLIVRRQQLDRLPALLPEFTRVEEDSWPARLVLRDASGSQIDFHPLTFDGSGDGWQELGDGTFDRYPAAGLRGFGRIGDRAVRCITAQLQLAHHHYAVGRPDDVDWDDVRVLCARVGLAVPQAYRQRPGFVEAKRSRAAPRSAAAT